MAGFETNTVAERETEQAITALKKGSYLLKYGRRGKPKFFPFRLSSDESLLIWYCGKKEKQLKLSHVSRIIPGQRTVIFQRYPQPEKEYRSFSLIYGARSLDLICKDQAEAEVWFTALQALISRGNSCKLRSGARSAKTSISSDSTHNHSRRNSTSNLSPCSSDFIYTDPGDVHTVLVPYNNSPQNGPGKAFSEVSSYTSAAKAYTQAESVTKILDSLSSEDFDNPPGYSSAVDSFRSSLSSAVSSSSQGSSHEDLDTLCDVLLWGKGIRNGLLNGGMNRTSSSSRMDALFPKVLESTVALDAHTIACGSKHAVLVTKQGNIFSWGEGSGGKLGHGVEADVSHPKHINGFLWSSIELAACGEFHTCAVTLSGDLYAWGYGIHNLGVFGHQSEASHWQPKRVLGPMEGLHISHVSCGPWHTAAVTSTGMLLTFGDGAFGALGHGDRSTTRTPREVETLRGLRTLRASCGVWHTAAVVEVTTGSSGSGVFPSGNLFTWGDGDKGQLGNGDKKARLAPACVAMSDDTRFRQVACGQSITIALTASGQVYSMGIADHEQIGCPESTNMVPTCIEGDIKLSYIEEVACGSHHIAVLSSKSEVYTWGKGAHGQLGHGDDEDRKTPTLVEALKDRQVKKVTCGSNFTAALCLHRSVSGADYLMCSGCRYSFSFRRKRHNCYNCRLAFCHTCSSKKSPKAAMAPNMNKPSRVCDECFDKLNSTKDSRSTSRIPRSPSASIHSNSNEIDDKEIFNSRTLRRFSRLASFDSLRQDNKQESKHNHKVDLRMVSRGKSPGSVKSSPESILDDPKQTNECISEETVILRAQVEDLTQKSQLLERKLERTSRKLKESTLTGQKEAEKNKVSEEMISSLTMKVFHLFFLACMAVVASQPLSDKNPVMILLQSSLYSLRKIL